jgi:hypothetical protein
MWPMAVASPQEEHRALPERKEKSKTLERKGCPKAGQSSLDSFGEFLIFILYIHIMGSPEQSGLIRWHRFSGKTSASVAQAW